MDNATILLKVQLRLNKLASSDYDNLEPWVIAEAFNKGQVAWCRRQLHGMNTKQTGDEQSKRRIDDLQVILSDEPVTLSRKDGFYETQGLPDNYFEWKRVSGKATTDCCADGRDMVIYLAEVGNVDELRRDKNKQPSFEWGETFAVLQDNKLRIYTNNEFDIPNAHLYFYRQPRRIQIAGVVDAYTNQLSTVDVESEFKDDINELFVDEAAKILAGDIESFNQKATANEQVETNN
jgi:hypothetical protein